MHPTDPSKYDDLATIPAEGLLTPVGVYKGISYENFDVAPIAILNESASGVIPHSDPNGAVAITTASTPPTLTALYSGSKVKTFSLSSVYYGCNAETAQAAISIAVACNITVTGYKAGSSSPYTAQTLKFIPEEPVDVMNPLTLGTFSSKFQMLQNVTFAVEPSLLTAPVIDNLVGSTQS